MLKVTTFIYNKTNSKRFLRSYTGKLYEVSEKRWLKLYHLVKEKFIYFWKIDNGKEISWRFIR